MYPIYEDDDQNEFAGAVGDAKHPHSDVHEEPTHHGKKPSDDHVHIALNRRGLTVTLILVVLSVAIVAAWQLDAFARVTDWYTDASVTVTVVEKDTHHALSEASVAISNQDAETNAQGKAAIDHLKSGKVSISVSKPAYLTKTYEATIYRGMNPLSDVVLEKAPEKIYTLSVTVTDAVSGLALKGAKVAVGETALSTLDTGKINLDLKSDASTAHITKDGYEPLDASLTLNKDGYDDIAAGLMPSRYIVYEQEKSGRTDLYVADFKGSAPVRLTDGKGTSSNSNPLISPDQKTLAFLSDRDGAKVNGTIVKRLFLLDDKGTVNKTTDDTSPQNMAWVNNSTILYSITNTIGAVTQDSVVSYNVVTKKRTVLSDTAPDALSATTIIDPTVAGDGQTVAYALLVTASGVTNPDLTGIYTVKVDGTGRKHVSKTDKKIYDLYFSADAKTIRYSYSDTNSFFTYQIDLSSGAEKDVSSSPTIRERAYSQKHFADMSQPLLSIVTKSGTFVYVDTKNGKTDLFSQAKDGKAEVQLTSLNTVSTIRLAPDEMYCLVTTLDTHSLYVVGISGGKPLKITDAFNDNVSFTFKPPVQSTTP